MNNDIDQLMKLIKTHIDLAMQDFIFRDKSDNELIVDFCEKHRIYDRDQMIVIPFSIIAIFNIDEIK